MKTESNPTARSGLPRALLFGGLLLLATVVWASWFAWRAHRNLVTLDVRDMEVRLVAKKIAWQTWENIFVHRDVEGKVTLKVHNMPLEQVLRMVGEQTFSRSSAIYPLYSNGESFVRLKKSLRGDVDPMKQGWTNLQTRAFGGGPPMMGFNMPSQAQNQLVSLNIIGKELGFATLALNRFAQARVVPEDGASATVNLLIKQATVPTAVSKLAKSAHLKWATVYALQGGRGPGGGFGGPQREGGPGNGGPRGFPGGEANGFGRGGFGGPEMTDAQRDEMRELRQQRQKLEEELAQALPTEERQKLEQAQREREQQMQAMANMTPEERGQQMMQQFGGAQMNRMMRDRVMNSTPEQRGQMDRPRNSPQNPGAGPGGGRGPGGRR